EVRCRVDRVREVEHDGTVVARPGRSAAERARDLDVQEIVLLVELDRSAELEVELAVVPDRGVFRGDQGTLAPREAAARPVDATAVGERASAGPGLGDPRLVFVRVDHRTV